MPRPTMSPWQAVVASFFFEKKAVGWQTGRTARCSNFLDSTQARSAFGQRLSRNSGAPLQTPNASRSERASRIRRLGHVRCDTVPARKTSSSAPNRLLERKQVFTDCLHLLTTHEPGNEIHVVPEVS